MKSLQILYEQAGIPLMSGDGELGDPTGKFDKFVMFIRFSR